MKRKPVHQDTLFELGQRLDHLHALISGSMLQHMQNEMRDGEISFSDLNAILFLNKNGAQSIDAIAKGINLSHAATSRLVERLVKRKLVSREKSVDDGRQKIIAVAKRGHAFMTELRNYTSDAYAAMLSDASESSLQNLLRALDRIAVFVPPHPLDKRK